MLTFKKWTLFNLFSWLLVNLAELSHQWLEYCGMGAVLKKTLHHRGRKRPIHSSSSPKHLLQNVISGIFSSSTHSVYRLEIANFLRTFSHVGIFDPALWSVLSPTAHLPFSLVHHYPSPLPCVNKYCICTIVNIQCVRGGRVPGCVGHYILQEFYTVYLTRFRTYKIARPPKTKIPRRGGGLRRINTCRKVLFQSIF